MFSNKDEGYNINGPSLIRVPSWLPNPLGRYYLYFAHHNGKYIRLAYADKLEGPWKIYEPGTLHLAQVASCRGHIASPDVVVDEEARQLRMYFHGPVAQPSELQRTNKQVDQLSYVATSTDGLHFTARPEPLSPYYLRVVRWNGWWYGVAKGGQLYRSRDGLTPFTKGPNPFPIMEDESGIYNKACPRHVALHLVGDTLWIYYSNIGDAPEHIRRCRLNLNEDWKTWRVLESHVVLMPQKPYEGAGLPVISSRAGAAKGEEHAVRDPAIFVENGKTYLVYSVAGEKGLGLAEIR